MMTFVRWVLPAAALAALLVVLGVATSAGARDRAGSQARAPAAAPGGSVAITGLTAGYSFGGGGNYRVDGPLGTRPGGVWVPIHVTLRNDGNDIVGRLVVSDNGPQTTNGGTGGNGGNGPSYRTDYTLNVALPGGSRKAVTLYVRAVDIGNSLTVSLQSGDHTLDSSTVAASPQQGGVLSVGVLSDDAATRAAFRPLKVGDTTLSVAQFNATTPLDTQSQALDCFDLIVLSNYSSNLLSAAQLAALRAWVQGGGTLLVAGGPDAQKTMTGLPADLLAATYRSVAATPTLPELAAAAGAGATTRGPVEYSVAAPAPAARALLAHDGTPLVADRPLGRGHLVYSAVEPTLAPLAEWPADAQGAFWRATLAPALTGSLDALVAGGAQNNSNANAAGSGSGTPLSNLAQDLGTTATHGLPALQVYVFLIVLYVLVLGPGNYLLLRWRRHLEWSWITIPVLAVLFGLGSFGLAYARNGGDVVTNVETVVYLDPGAPAKEADSYVGLLAPLRGDYDLTSPNPALTWGLGGDNVVAAGSSGGPPLGMRVDEGVPFAAHLVGLQLWTVRNVGLHQQLAVPGAVTGRLTLGLHGVRGDVTNGTPYTLYDCAIVGANGASAVIPRIKSGQSIAIPAFMLSSSGNTTNPAGGNGPGPLTNLYSGLVGEGGPGAQAAGPRSLASSSRYNDLLTYAFPGGTAAMPGAPLAFLGWSSAPLTPLFVNGATPHRSDLDLFVAPLEPTLVPGAFAVAPGDLPLGVIGTSVTINNGATGANGLTLNSGDHVDVQFVLPAVAPGHRLRVDTLTLQSSLNGSTLSSDSTQVWDWTARRWAAVDLSGGAATWRHAGAYVSSDGRVRLRAQATQGNQLTFNNVDQDLQIGVTGSVR